MLFIKKNRTRIPRKKTDKRWFYSCKHE